jgi:hypothetical protein
LTLTKPGVTFYTCATFGEAATKSPVDIEGFVNLHLVTFDRNDFDLWQIQILKGNCGVKLHKPAKFGEHRTINLGGVVEETNKQTTKQTNGSQYDSDDTMYIC